MMIISSNKNDNNDQNQVVDVTASIEMIPGGKGNS